jgi:hypothetical protein
MDEAISLFFFVRNTCNIILCVLLKCLLWDFFLVYLLDLYIIPVFDCGTQQSSYTFYLEIIEVKKLFIYKLLK